MSAKQSYSYVTKASWINSSFCVLSFCILISQNTQNSVPILSSVCSRIRKRWEENVYLSIPLTSILDHRGTAGFPSLTWLKKCQIPRNICPKLSFQTGINFAIRQIGLALNRTDLRISLVKTNRFPSLKCIPCLPGGKQRQLHCVKCGQLKPSLKTRGFALM